VDAKTWALIGQHYERYPGARAEGVTPGVFDTELSGYPVERDYRTFVVCYGGGLVGAYPIYVLALASFMGTVGGARTAPALTEFFRSKAWPEVGDWLVFTVDGFGNPIGFRPDGAVWISDAVHKQVSQLADNFEDFLLKWALGLRPVGDYPHGP
jgi:hypothetical protein